MAIPWSRVINSTIKNFIREREVNVLRNRKLTALLKKRGRLSFNWSGTKMDWKVKYRRVRLTPFADGDVLSFDRKDRHKTAEIDWRGYSLTDSMTKGEFLQNRSKEAIIKLYSSIATDLMDDAEDFFGEEFYINGNLPQNAKRIHGLETFLAANQNVGNGAGTPTATYAGLSCVPGYYGGNWNASPLPSWPNGYGDPQYDFWSPIVVDYGDTLFPGNTLNPDGSANSGGTNASPNNTWTNNCIEAVAFGIIKSKKSKSARGMLDVIFLNDELYRTYLRQARVKERIMVDRGQASGLVQLGFLDVINQDGVDLTWEYGTPGGVGYGFNIDMMEVRSMQAQVFVPEGPDFNLTTKSWQFSIDMYGNVVYNPKFFVKFHGSDQLVSHGRSGGRRVRVWLAGRQS